MSDTNFCFHPQDVAAQQFGNCAAASLQSNTKPKIFVQPPPPPLSRSQALRLGGDFARGSCAAPHPASRAFSCSKRSFSSNFHWPITSLARFVTFPRGSIPSDKRDALATLKASRDITW